MDFEGAFLAWTALAIFIPLALSVAVPGIYRTWVEYRSRSKALDVLRVYAEKGQEPPTSVIAAISAVALVDKPGLPPVPGGPSWQANA